MTTDLRGFDYALEPLRRKRQWQLEAAQAALGRLERELSRAIQRVAELRETYDAERRHAAESLVSRSDPAAHRRSLGWLAEQRRAIARAEEFVARLREDRKALVARCTAEQQALEILERHREECQATFIREAEARAYTDTDREWLSRLGLHAGGAALRRAGPGGTP